MVMLHSDYTHCNNINMIKKHSGFTIVELLIVIVVIGILAAIVIVAFNGVQQRARYAQHQSDIASVDKAIQLYYADTGSYPTISSAGGNTGSCATCLNNINGLVPKYIARLPSFPPGGTGYYVYIINGVNYKLVRLVGTAADLPAAEQSNPRPDTARPGRGWGTWSPGGGSL